MKSTLRLVVWGGVGSVLLCVVAQATPWEIDYKGNTLPEQSNPIWQRSYSPPGDTRTIQANPNLPGNNLLVIDSQADHLVYDWAEYVRPMDPHGSQERFWSEWRMSILSQIGLDGDQGVALKDERGHVAGFTFRYSQIYSYNDGWTFPIAPGVFHTYRLESAAFMTYRLWIDGTPVRDAPFFEGLGGPYAHFGDIGSSGGPMGSLVQWDYLRFGVTLIPEPFSLSTVMIAVAVCGVRRGRI